MAIYNIDELIQRNKQTVILGGIEIDITRVPLIVNATVDRIWKRIQDVALKEQEGGNTEALEIESQKILDDMLELFEIIARKNENSDEICREWALKNLDNQELWQFIMMCAKKDIIKSSNKKKVTEAKIES
jgi:hypothetical protein